MRDGFKRYWKHALMLGLGLAVLSFLGALLEGSGLVVALTAAALAFDMEL